MPRIGQPPRRTMGAEDISNLQFGPGHPGARSLQTSLHRLILQFGQHLVGADSVADRLGGHMSVSRSGRQLGVAEQHLNNPHVGVCLQKVGGKTVSQYMRTNFLIYSRSYSIFMKDIPNRHTC